MPTNVSKGDEVQWDDVVWRYMTFLQFTDILLTNELFFCRLTHLFDPLEGYYDANTVKELSTMMKVPPSVVSATEKFSRRTTCVSCWHRNDVESAAMWEIYSRPGGVAIRTTARALGTSIINGDGGVNVLIDAMDYDASRSDVPFLSKRKSFEHEKEIRAFIHDAEPDGPKRIGTRIRVHTPTLIQAVFIDPRAEEWVTRVVQGTLMRFGLNVQAKQSNLYSRDIR